jgi:hypothetical protein
MNDARTTPQTDPAGSLRARRREAGLVAQYIHERSERHARSRSRGRDRETRRGTDHTTDPEGS